MKETNEGYKTTLYKNRSLTKPPKRFRRCQKASRCIEMLKETVIEIYETLKILTVCPGEEPSPAEPF